LCPVTLYLDCPSVDALQTISNISTFCLLTLTIAITLTSTVILTLNLTLALILNLTLASSCLSTDGHTINKLSVDKQLLAKVRFRIRARVKVRVRITVEVRVMAMVRVSRQKVEMLLIVCRASTDGQSK
jgi:hypothetical protein